MPTKGKSNLYGRGKRGQPNEHISYKYTKMFIQSRYNRHFEKHGHNEMGLSSDQYRSMAISFANNVDRQNHLSFVNDVGLTVKFSKKTNEFAMITQEGNVATYFKTSQKEYERVKRYYGK